MDKLTPKEFALKAIAPYYKDPSTCGYKSGSCQYLTNNGKKCVLGAHMLHPEEYDITSGSARSVLTGRKQEDILIPEAVDILTIDQWESLQSIHDRIAIGDIENYVQNKINTLGLFTLEELKEYCLTH